ncbi:MAG: DNA polymerase III subunit gamma/tau [bacterium]|nr:DNA polymerase III subunit gamma/tau [bacterium]
MSENYIPLYRKYRPQTLDTLVGQEHIKKTLTSAIELGKISHAYLFTGPRGTGKTSTARILAKSLNCKNGPTIHPCGECESCRNITDSIPIDVIEIDAASNRKVEDTQNLLEKIQYVPVNGKYKIYIIDEVHMLSNTAFNALLKTLEEPPENVIFILATTEVHKVLDTIKSRCQRYDFKRITTNDIVKHLRYISEKEDIRITDDALFAIAKNSAGGMRDSISLLDQLSILGYSREVTTDDVNSVLGRMSFDILFKLSDKIFDSSSSEAIAMLNEIYNSGNEPLLILSNLSEYFKNLLIAKTCSLSLLPDLTGLNEPQIKELTEQAKKLETQQIVFLIERLSGYIKEVKFAVNQYLWLEVAIIDLSNMTENSTLLDLQNRIKVLEAGNSVPSSAYSVQRTVEPIKHNPKPLENTSSNQQPPSTINEQQNVGTSKEIEHGENDFTPPPMAKKSVQNPQTNAWQSLLANIDTQGTKAMLMQLSTPLVVTEDEVVIAFKGENYVTRMNESSRKLSIQNAVEKVFGKKDIPVTIRLLSDSDKASCSQMTEQTEKKNLTDNIQFKNEEIEKVEAVQAKVITEPKKLKFQQPQNDNQVVTLKSERQKTDMEKMVLDLFDGKYVK